MLLTSVYCLFVVLFFTEGSLVIASKRFIRNEGLRVFLVDILVESAID